MSNVMRSVRNSMFDVESAIIARIGYEEKTQTALVQFKNGAIYRYFEVSSDQFDALRVAESIGSHFNKNFKYARKFEKLLGPQDKEL